MLYLEDYLEMIEHLPQELRDRFTEMREMDLSVQNNMDTLEKRIRILFSQCRRGEIASTQADNEFYTIRKDYYKTLEDSDEKVQLASQMYELVERYLRRLDSESYKFKCELEADHNGITEILEKRSLELDTSSSTSHAKNQKENRYFGMISGSNSTHRENRYRHKPEKRRDSSGSGILEKRQVLASGSVPISSTPTTGRPSTPNLSTHYLVPPVTPNQSYSLQNIGPGNAIAAAASQAIAATQQMQQGRRTASLKASYEAIHGSAGTSSHELLIGRELAGATHNAIQAVEREGNSFNSQRRQKKKITTSLSQASTASPSSSSSAHSLSIQQPNINESGHASVPVNDNSLVVDQAAEGEWTYDPNEPRYCICNQVSYGDMVACDNEDCPFEWFHYPCVGITQSPKGKWYCPQCTTSMRRRGSRKN